MVALQVVHHMFLEPDLLACGIWIISLYIYADVKWPINICLLVISPCSLLCFLGFADSLTGCTQHALRTRLEYEVFWCDLIYS